MDRVIRPPSDANGMTLAPPVVAGAFGGRLGGCFGRRRVAGASVGDRTAELGGRPTHAVGFGDVDPPAEIVHDLAATRLDAVRWAVAGRF